MRKSLQKIQNVRDRFSGTFVRYGTKPGYQNNFIIYAPKKTILLKDVIHLESGRIVDHLWFNLTKGFEQLGPFFSGDVIEFDARVKSYTKGYFGRKENVFKPPGYDYKLSHPTKIKLIAHSLARRNNHD